MKPYHTSFLRVAACLMLLCSLSFTSQRASANCDYFTLQTQDSVWSFSAAIGGTQSRTLIVTNNSDSTLVLDAAVYTSSFFTLNHTQFTIYAHDTASVVITFAPTSGANSTITANIRFAKHGTDCRQYFGLSGSITGTNGGHDKVVKISPSPEDFPAVPAGKDTCLVMYLINYTGGQVKIESMRLLHGNTDFKIDPAFTTGSMDSGGYYRFHVCCTGDANHTEFSDSLIVTYSDGTGLHTIGALLVGHTSSNTTGGGDGLVADPHAFSFGTVAADSTVCRSVIVTNKSKHTVVIGGWSQCDSKDFSVSPAYNSYDTLASGASITLTICYTPTASDSGSKSCNVAIKYYIADSGATWQTISVSFYGVKAGSNTTHHDACLHTEQGDNYHDAIVVGATADHTLYLINNTSHSITINSATITGTDASLFALVTSLPIIVPANTSKTELHYSFSPTSNSRTEFNATITLGLNGDSLTCHSVDGHLIGYAVHSINTVDTVVRPLFPNESRTLGLEGNGATVTTTFYFTNNLSVDCTVNKIWLTDPQYFSIASTNPAPPPFVLHPGDNLTVVITYTANDHHVHYDSLMIDANHNLQAQGFQLQGLQLGAASVSASLPEGVAINVSPNPASSYVTVDMAGIRSADIQVIDLLGKTVSTAKASTTWKWNASSAVAGSYIVRIAGESASGEQFVASKRIIVAR